VPPQIAAQYRDKGVRLDPACVLLEELPSNAMPEPHEINYDYSIGALVIGGMLAFFGAFAFSLGKLMARLAQPNRRP
jgi:hypothetical protein